jgi:hypothetical protein
VLTPPLKVTASPQEVAEAFFEYTIKHFDDLDELANSFGVDVKLLDFELKMLKTFAVDFATSRTLSGTKEKKAVLDDYWAFWGEPLAHEPDGELKWNYIRGRIFAYADALNTKHELGPAWPIGKAFSGFLECGMDAIVINYGALVFSGGIQRIAELLKKVKISV